MSDLEDVQDTRYRVRLQIMTSWFHVISAKKKKPLLDLYWNEEISVNPHYFLLASGCWLSGWGSSEESCKREYSLITLRNHYANHIDKMATAVYSSVFTSHNEHRKSKPYTASTLLHSLHCIQCVIGLDQHTTGPHCTLFCIECCLWGINHAIWACVFLNMSNALYVT